MKREKISEIMGQIGTQYINEAAEYHAETRTVHRSVWVKWAMAACVVLFMAVALVQSGFSGIGTQTAILDNGEKIFFAKLDSAAGESDIAFYIETRTLTGSEIADLFGELPVEAYALFNAENDEILGLEGKIGDMKLIVSVPGVSLNDTVIEGAEGVSAVGGTPVRAGYFVSGKTIIYYAHFSMDGNTVYLEHAGAKKNSDLYRNEIAVMIQKLIALQKMDIHAIRR